MFGIVYWIELVFVSEDSWWLFWIFSSNLVYWNLFTIELGVGGAGVIVGYSKRLKRSTDELDFGLLLLSIWIVDWEMFVFDVLFSNEKSDTSL